MTDQPIRPAASLILLRDVGGSPKVLMGQRGAGAAFFPNKYVFPGGAVDRADGEVPFARPLPEPCATRLAFDSALSPEAIAAAAVRELWEETGLLLGQPGKFDHAPQGWRGFFATGHLPDAGALRFLCRAVTPPGRPRRFDARFFIANAEALATDPDDFSRAEDELGHLHWVPLDQARRLDLPAITTYVLTAAIRNLAEGGPPARVPYFAQGVTGWEPNYID